MGFFPFVYDVLLEKKKSNLNEVPTFIWLEMTVSFRAVFLLTQPLLANGAKPLLAWLP